MKRTSSSSCPYNARWLSGEGLGTWDWLADLCEAEDRPCGLGHALSMRAIHGGQAQNDRRNAHKIAALRRGGLLSQAYVDPRRMRATHDRWRRRTHLMHTRAEWSALLQHTASQDHLSAPWGRLATPQNRRALRARVAHRGLPQHMAVDTARIDWYDPRLAAWERYLEQTAAAGCYLPLSTLRCQVALLLTPHRVDGIRSLNRLPGKGLACEGGHPIPTPKTRLLDVKVEDEVHIPISIHILNVSLPMGFCCLVRPKCDIQGVYSGGIKIIGRQDSYRDLAFALRVDAVGKAARFDVNGNLGFFRGKRVEATVIDV